LKEQTLVVVPSTFNPNTSKPFLLAVYSDSLVQLNRLDEDQIVDEKQESEEQKVITLEDKIEGTTQEERVIRESTTNLKGPKKAKKTKKSSTVKKEKQEKEDE
jgi:hypothetical protein